MTSSKKQNNRQKGAGGGVGAVGKCPITNMRQSMSINKT